MTNQQDGEPEPTLTPWERNFRERMELIRKRMGLNQTELARRVAGFGLPFHQQTIQRIEAGSRPVRLNEAIVIASVLEIPLNTMTATMAAAEQEVSMEVERLRGRSAADAAQIADMLAELSDAVGPLVLLVSELLEHKDDPERKAALRYGFTWLNTFWDIHAYLYRAWDLLQSVDEGEETASTLPLPEIEAMEHWWDVHDDLFGGEHGQFPKLSELIDDSAQE